MDVNLVREPIPTVIVSGEIDHFNAPRVVAVVREACDLGNHLIVDLTDVTYLDSAGVQLVFLAGRLTHEKDRQLKLVVTNRNVSRILELTGVEALPNLEVVADLNTAKKHLEK